MRKTCQGTRGFKVILKIISNFGSSKLVLSYLSEHLGAWVELVLWVFKEEVLLSP